VAYSRSNSMSSSIIHLIHVSSDEKRTIYLVCTAGAKGKAAISDAAGEHGTDAAESLKTDG